MIAKYNQAGLNIKGEQLNDLAKLISIVSSATGSEVQALKTTMLMYLPWLPLTDPNAFKLEVGSSGSDCPKRILLWFLPGNKDPTAWTNSSKPQNKL